MIQLFIDTSQPYLVLALITPRGIQERIVSHSNRLGEVLSHEVLQLITSCDLTFKDIQEIRVGIGPGSYTGTRVGVAFAEALGYGLSIPVIKLPSLVFYLEKDETTLCLASNFETYGLIQLVGHSLSYTQTTIDNLPAKLRTLKPPLTIPSPNWLIISHISPKEPFKALLYFNLL